MPDVQRQFVIRSATNQDIPRIQDLVFSVLREYALRPDPDSADADLEDVEASYFGRGGSFEVVEDAEGGIVGTVGLFPLDGRRVELRKMYLATPLRGRGWGRLLLERSLRQSRELGFEEVWLETNSRLKEAVRLYEQYGFRRIESDHVAARCDRAYLLKLSEGKPQP
jgi:putative acetyltransferase